MKQTIIVISSLFFFSNLFSQNPFEIKPTSVWKVDKLINVISKKDKRAGGDESYKLFVNQDTAINSFTYHKIYKTGILYTDSSAIRYKDQYFGAVRESAHKVLYIEKNKTTERLLYDYDLNVGDTVKGLVARDHKVLSIDTLPDGRKCFHLSKTMLHAMDQYIVEGIGSSGGLFNEPPVGHYMYNDSYLVCYAENYELIFSGVDYFECGCGDIATVNEAFMGENIGISLYPNPARQKFSLEINSNNNFTGTIEIVNLLGMRVFNSKFTHLPGLQKINFEMSCLTRGLYLVEIKTAESRVTRKLLIE
jgi:hypothetical protein